MMTRGRLGLLERVGISLVVAAVAVAVELGLQNAALAACLTEGAGESACAAAHRDWGRAVGTGLAIAIVVFGPFVWRGTRHYRQQDDGSTSTTPESKALARLRRLTVSAAALGFGLLPLWIVLGSSALLTGALAALVVGLGCFAYRCVLPRADLRPDA